MVKLGLVKEEEMSFMSDDDIANLINKVVASGDYELLELEEDWVLYPKEYQDKFTWICR
ncbi:hypothetical protein [Sediminibacillus massiliensis]|uniref:hypothetical protein n=1 Tax=Sediminibacillus massiliensis TaxID=1926277 RepID=UPI0015C3893E|nr:hypothetical protein [Sediminibacillus massiliensis]